MKLALTIAGSDPSGGAGIEQDLRVWQSLGIHGMAIATALTVQNADEVKDVKPVNPQLVSDRMQALFEAHPPSVIKLGMVANADVAQAVAEGLQRWAGNIPLVHDPVLSASSGTHLLEPSGLRVLLKRLLPRTTVLTPNWDEAVRLSLQVASAAGTHEECAAALQKAGADWICITGGDRNEPKARDFVSGLGVSEYMEGERHPGPSPHGTGCAFSAATAAFLKPGQSPFSALKAAKAYVSNAIGRARPLDAAGQGRRVLVFDGLQ
ncbi:MAG: hydroxymethylpyrimidine/phosphomethylpyrimidine kinase [Planctomycetota bacterium]